MIRGQIRWISDKGYGFVETTEHGPVFASSKVMNGFAPGQNVLIETENGQLGLQATLIQPLAQPLGEASPQKVAS